MPKAKKINLVITGSKTASIQDISDAERLFHSEFPKLQVNQYFGTGSYGAGALLPVWALARKFDHSLRKPDWSKGKMAAKARNADLIRDSKVLLIVGPIDHNGDYYLNRDYRLERHRTVLQVVDGELHRDEQAIYGKDYQLPTTIVKA
jgi:hypothetical protein